MECYENIDLCKFNTMRLHSIARVVYIPHNEEELVAVCRELMGRGERFYTLSAGSNVIFAERVETAIISLMRVDESITRNCRGEIVCGASVRIQSLINYLQGVDLGGIEYLYSLPASVGGATYMNAGRGRSHNRSISDYVVSARYLDLDDLTIKEIYDVGAESGYRTSVFQRLNCVILSVTFKFSPQLASKSDELIKERLSYTKRVQPTELPSSGSVFSRYNRYTMYLLRGMRCGGALYSKRTNNWISNLGGAIPNDVMRLIDRAIRLHRLLGQSCKLELRIYK
ncbi:MAG: FAD-binding protein [Rikenellaceae bacterium]